MVGYRYAFHGKSAHAAAAPEAGINALNAVMHLFSGIDAMRQHLREAFSTFCRRASCGASGHHVTLRASLGWARTVVRSGRQFINLLTSTVLGWTVTAVVLCVRGMLVATDRGAGT